VFSKQFKKGKKCHVTLWLISLHPPCVIWWHCRGPLECHVLFEWLLMNLKTCLELFESKNVCMRVRLGSIRHLYKYHTRVEGQEMPKKCHLLFEWPLSCFLNLDYHQRKLITIKRIPKCGSSSFMHEPTKSSLKNLKFLIKF